MTNMPVRYYVKDTTPQVPSEAIAVIAQALRRVSASPTIEAEWLNLLNESWAGPNLQAPAYAALSHEAYWLAHYYASRLSGVPSDYWQAVAALQQPSLPRWRSFVRVYLRIPQLLQAATITPLEIHKMGFRSVTVRWNPTTSLRQIAPENQDMYLQDTVRLVGTTLRGIPTGSTVFNEVDQGNYYEWTVAWQEDTHRRGRIVLWIGAVISFLLALGSFLNVLPMASEWRFTFIPLAIGLGWAWVLNLRQYAGEQEYAHLAAMQQTTEQVGTLESLHRIDRELNNALSLDRVLSLWLDWAIRLSYPDAASVWLVEGDKLVLSKDYGYQGAVIPKILDITSGVRGRAVQAQRAYYIPQVSDEKDYIALAPSTSSLFVVPIAHQDQPVAVLALEKQEPDGFSALERARIARLCERASAALMNAVSLRQTELERQKLGTVLATTADIMIVVDEHDQIILTNPAAVGLLGLDLGQDYRGQLFASSFAASGLPVALEEERSELEYRNTTYQISVVPMPEVGRLIVLHDITLYKELDKLKNELVATVSHDLKNPLAAIRGYLELIEIFDPLSERSKGYVENAKRAIYDMTQLIEDLLSVARLEAGITLEPVATELLPVIQDVVEKNRVHLEHKKLEVAFDVPMDLPRVLVDGARLVQILNNLVNNAIKYSEEGRQIRLQAYRESGKVHVKVQDQGVGIPMDALPTIFDKFTRVRDEKTEHIKGTGLGLYIVKKLVEAHQGEVWVNSVYGEGSTFVFTLPIVAA
ncbi:MAG: GAF domain-containing protein [Anaerolineales bacterium]|nr:GAF domain-containing protein [Anaerolineales bacterium]